MTGPPERQSRLMTMISYLTRTHFADSAIEDALPEEARSFVSALLIADDEPGTASALERVRDALPKITLVEQRLRRGGPSRAEAARHAAELRNSDIHAIIAVGGAAAAGQARLSADAAQRNGSACAIIAVPVGLFDLGLSRHVRPRGDEPAVCPRPNTIIADPTVLTHLPAKRLAAAGMEALVHAVEAYASPVYNPPADALALDAVRRFARWLPACVPGPASAETRRELMAAALTAGLAMEKAVGGVDALARPLEEDLGARALPGELHAPVLAAFVDFNARAVGERYAALSDALGHSKETGGLAGRIAMLARDLGLPAGLRDTATDRSGFARVARLAADDPSALANPRRLTPVDCRRILEAAW